MDLRLISRVSPQSLGREPPSDDEDANGASDYGSVYSRTPSVTVLSLEIEMTPGASTVHSAQGDDEDDVQIVHTIVKKAADSGDTDSISGRTEDDADSVLHRSIEDKDLGDNSFTSEDLHREDEDAAFDRSVEYRPKDSASSSFVDEDASYESDDSAYTEKKTVLNVHTRKGPTFDSNVLSTASSVPVSDSDSELEYRPRSANSALRSAAHLGKPFDLDKIPESPSTIRETPKKIAPALPLEELAAAQSEITQTSSNLEDDIKVALQGSIESLVKLRRVSQVPSYDLGSHTLRKSRSPSRSPNRSPVNMEFDIPEPFPEEEPEPAHALRSPVELTPLTRLEPPSDLPYNGEQEIVRRQRRSSIKALVDEGSKYLPLGSDNNSRASSISIPVPGSNRPKAGSIAPSDLEDEQWPPDEHSRSSSPVPFRDLKIETQHLQPDDSGPEAKRAESKPGKGYLRLPETPTLKLPGKTLDEHLNEKINNILTSLPSRVKLTAQNLKKLQEDTPVKRNLSFAKGTDSMSVTHIPGPKSVTSNVSTGSSIPYSRGVTQRQYSGQFSASETKLYHLHREGQAPIKLLVRLVGPNGERVMVRIGGGWADLAEYLKEYALHHGSGRRSVSNTAASIEIQDLANNTTSRTLHPSSSTGRNTQRSVSVTLGSPTASVAGSRPSSPLLPTGPKGNRSFSSLSPPTGPKAGRPESPQPTLRTTSVTMRGGYNGGVPRPGSSLSSTRPGSSLSNTRPGSSLSNTRPGTSLGHSHSRPPPSGPAASKAPPKAPAGPAAAPKAPAGTPVASAAAPNAPAGTPVASAAAPKAPAAVPVAPAVPAVPTAPAASAAPAAPAAPKAVTGLAASRYAHTTTLSTVPKGPAGPRTPTGPRQELRQEVRQELTPPTGPRNASRPASSQGNYRTPPQTRPPSSHRSGSYGNNLTPSPNAPTGPSGGFGGRPHSRLSFSSTGGDRDTLAPAAPLGLAGPKAKELEISPEKQAWVDGMLGEVRKASAGRGTGGAAYGSAVGDEEEEDGAGKQQMHRNRFGYGGGQGWSGDGGAGAGAGAGRGGTRVSTGTGPETGAGAGGRGAGRGSTRQPSGAIGEINKVGYTRRVYVKRQSFT
ncbi:hypothetical protein BDZ91DRAFT_484619 [Kalaharituber pfeilii]|nr:hypothetical protein BDZ91DRAFT_484619 [Kalaharituber pfeilii]